MKNLCLILVIAIGIGLLPSMAQSEVEINGYMFGEYYYVINHHNAYIENRHGFWLRRIYFTYNNELTDDIKMRLRLEMNSPGDFASSARLTPFVKDAYLSIKLSKQNVMLGLIATPTWKNIEDFWGYRAVEKTPLDLQQMGSSRDLGIGLTGDLNKGKTISYSILFGNGSSIRGETDKGKKVYASLTFNLVNGLFLEVYGDFEAMSNDRSYYVYQGFAGYKGKWGRIGAMYARRHFNQEILDADDVKYNYDVFSIFAVVKAREKVDIIARYDKTFGNGFEDNYNGSRISYIPFADDSTSHLIIGGASWEVAGNVWLIPNIKYVFYDLPDVGIKPDDNIYANMTVFFKF